MLTQSCGRCCCWSATRTRLRCAAWATAPSLSTPSILSPVRSLSVPTPPPPPPLSFPHRPPPPPLVHSALLRIPNVSPFCFSVLKQGSLSNRKQVQLGTQPLALCAVRGGDGGPAAIAAGDRPALLHVQGSKLALANINFEEVCAIIIFGLITDSIVVIQLFILR
jgi:hypothetical protein